MANTVEIVGWIEGFNKVGMTRLLRSTGMRLSDAKSATDAILDLVPTIIDLPPDVDKEVFSSQAKALGAVIKE